MSNKSHHTAKTPPTSCTLLGFKIPKLPPLRSPLESPGRTGSPVSLCSGTSPPRGPWRIRSPQCWRSGGTSGKASGGASGAREALHEIGSGVLHGRCIQMEFYGYPLVNIIFNGKIHYFDWAMSNSELLNYQRVNS